MQATYWIKLYNTLLDWEWKTDPKMVALWVHILLCANNEDGKFMGKPVQRGQFITSLAHLSRDIGLSVMTVRTCLKRLEKSECITTQSTNRNTYITICNYDSYQCKKNKTNKQLTNNQQGTNEQLTTIIDIRNKNKENNITTNNNNKQFFQNWEECKNYLVQTGRTNCTDAGYKRFYKINQIGTKNTTPYWYTDGIEESFDKFMAKPDNKKLYLPKVEGKGKGKGNAPQVAAGSPKTLSVADFNIKIANIMKQPMSQREREDLLSLKYQGDRNEKGELIICTNKDSWNRLMQSDLKGVLGAEFRGYRLAPTII